MDENIFVSIERHQIFDGPERCSAWGLGELGSSLLGESYFSKSAWGPGTFLWRQGRILFRDSRAFPFKAKDPIIWIGKMISPMVNLEVTKKSMAISGRAEEDAPVLRKWSSSQKGRGKA